MQYSIADRSRRAAAAPRSTAGLMLSSMKRVVQIGWSRTPSATSPATAHMLGPIAAT